MKRLAKRRRGQFIVAAAMFIALIILSMSLLIYSAGSRYQTLEKEPVREIVQTITDDFKRMLTIALADYSEDPDDTAFNRAVSGWADKTIYCYSGMGLQLDVTIPDENPYFGHNDEGDSFEIDVASVLNLNITSIGFYGYKYPLQIKLNVTIDEALWGSYNIGGKLYMDFLNITVTAFKEENLTVSDLKITALKITVRNDSSEEDIYFTDKDMTEYLDVTYISGYGTYIITLKPDKAIPTSLEKITDLEAYLEFMDGRGIKGYAQKVGVNVNLIYVSDITMTYQLKGSKYHIYTDVTVSDRLGKPVSGATVTLSITLPNNETTQLTAKTGNDGIANFELTVPKKKQYEGTYKAIVVNVDKKGYLYNPNFNVKTEETLTIP